METCSFLLISSSPRTLAGFVLFATCSLHRLGTTKGHGIRKNTTYRQPPPSTDLVHWLVYWPGSCAARVLSALCRHSRNGAAVTGGDGNATDDKLPHEQVDSIPSFDILPDSFLGLFFAFGPLSVINTIPPGRSFPPPTRSFSSWSPHLSFILTRSIITVC